MDYLYRVLKVRTHIIEDMEGKGLPRYLTDRYRIRKAMLDETVVFLLYPKTELNQIDAVRKHVLQLRKLEKIPVVLILDRLSYYQKKSLLEAGIPFIVEGKQIYLPFMGAYLQERCDAQTPVGEQLTPSAQLLLLFYIYGGEECVNTSAAVHALSLTATSISRASRQLVELGLLRSERHGVDKRITAGCGMEELWEKALPMLQNPVRKTIYVSRTDGEQLLLSGYSALSEYSMLNPPALPCCAVYRNHFWSVKETNQLVNADTQMMAEIWRYDPEIFAKDRCVDVLSLSLSLRDDPDERVEGAVEEMLNAFWKEQYGQGHTVG